jgi:hypothetical protein
VKKKAGYFTWTRNWLPWLPKNEYPSWHLQPLIQERKKFNAGIQNAGFFQCGNAGKLNAGIHILVK